MLLPRLALVGAGSVLALTACAGASGAPASPTAPSPVGGAASPSAPLDSATPDPAVSASASPTATATSSPASGPTHLAAPLPGIVASGLTEPRGAARAGTFALGDSFLLGSKRVLTAAHVRVDAEVGRQFYEGIPELRAVVRSGTLPRNVVVHLGTNGTITSKHCDSIIATAGPARRVFLVTVIGPRSWMAPNVTVLKACAARHRTQVVLVDWAAVSGPHPSWFGPDRVHPNPTGRKQYNALILEALREYAA